MIDFIRTFALTSLYTRRQWYTAKRLKALQLRRLERLVSRARTFSPFFRSLYHHLPPRGFRLSDLPLVTKSMMLEHFDEYVTDRRLKLGSLRRFVADPVNIGRKYLGYVVFHTSGTCGEPAVIVYDQSSFSHIRAVSLARTMGRNPRPSTFWGMLHSPLRVAGVLMDGGLYPSYSNFIHLPALARLVSDVRVFSLRDPLDRLVNALQTFQPSILMGYPSILSVLAYEQLAGRLSLLGGRKGDLVVSLGEPLSAHTDTLLRRAFACPLIDIYGAGECLVIAQSCGVCGPDNGTKTFPHVLHVNDDLAILEVVDREGRPAAPGTEGNKVYLTNLVNFVQPFIRYEITDVVSPAAAPCACGRTLSTIHGVSGRTDDIVYLGCPGGGTVILHPYWLITPFLEFPTIKDWQVAQTGRNELSVTLAGPPGTLPTPVRVEEALRRSLIQAGMEAPVTFLFKKAERIEPDSLSGKVRRIWSAVGPPNA